MVKIKPEWQPVEWLLFDDDNERGRIYAEEGVYFAWVFDSEGNEHALQFDEDTAYFPGLEAAQEAAERVLRKMLEREAGRGGGGMYKPKVRRGWTLHGDSESLEFVRPGPLGRDDAAAIWRSVTYSGMHGWGVYVPVAAMEEDSGLLPLIKGGRCDTPEQAKAAAEAALLVAGYEFEEGGNERQTDYFS